MFPCTEFVWTCVTQRTTLWSAFLPPLYGFQGLAGVSQSNPNLLGYLISPYSLKNFQKIFFDFHVVYVHVTAGTYCQRSPRAEVTVWMWVLECS